MNIEPTGSSSAGKSHDRVVAAAAPAAPKPAAHTDNAIKLKKLADQDEPTRDQVDNAVKTLNAAMTESSQDLQFTVDKDTKQTVVKLVDRVTHEVLRQMPSKEALELAKSLDKAIGKLIDHQA